MSKNQDAGAAAQPKPAAGEVRRRRAGEPIRLLPPTYVDLPVQEASEVVDYLAEVMIRALRRRSGQGQ